MIFITGGTGFIGSNLVDSFLEEGKGVYLLTRKDKCRLESHENLKKIKGDIMELTDIPDDVEIIYHCAGAISDEERMMDINVGGTERMAVLALRHKIPMIHLSSAGVIGKTNQKVIDEETPPNPVSLYEKSKLEAEEVLRHYMSRGLKALILRPTIVFGEGKDPEKDSFFHLILAIIKGRYFHVDGGKGIYNIVHVSEVVKAMRILGEADRFWGCIFFLNTPISFFNFAETVFDAFYNRKPSYKSIPFYCAYPLAIFFSSLSVITGRKMPFGLSRLFALTNKRIISSQRILTATHFEFKKDVREHIKSMVNFYIQKGFVSISD